MAGWDWKYAKEEAGGAVAPAIASSAAAVDAPAVAYVRTAADRPVVVVVAAVAAGCICTGVGSAIDADHVAKLAVARSKPLSRGCL